MNKYIVALAWGAGGLLLGLGPALGPGGLSLQLGMTAVGAGISLFVFHLVDPAYVVALPPFVLAVLSATIPALMQVAQIIQGGVWPSGPEWLTLAGSIVAAIISALQQPGGAKLSLKRVRVG